MLLGAIARGQTIPPEAREALGAPGGLVVHVDANDVAQAAALNSDSRFLVHFLYSESSVAEKASSAVVAGGLEGRVTVSVFDGENLPFVDNCVNAIVIWDAGSGMLDEEIKRVLVPRGVAVKSRSVRGMTGYVTVVKRIPSSIDDWTHNLYDAGNSGVSSDLEAGSPRHMQWTANPRFSRSHDGNSSILSMVSAGGRVFYMMDEGSTAFLSLPSKWNLVARDAFNGKLLWRKPLPQTLLMQIGNIKSGFANLSHRMVAQEETLYATLGFNAPVTALDSRTGDELWTSTATESAEELILFDGVLFCVVNMSDASRVKHPFQAMEDIKRLPAATIPRKLVALDAKTGDVLWEKTPPSILPLSLAAGKPGVFIHDGASIVAMDPRSGEERWRSEPIAFYGKLQQYSGVNMVLVDGVMLYSCGTAFPHKGRDHKSDWHNTITALDAESGKILWRAPHRQDGIFVTPDLLVADGLVWHAPIDSGHSSGDYVGMDLKTGKVVREFKCEKRKQMPHHRCYRNRATERNIFTGWTGVNIFSCRTGEWDHNYWIRGACRYGVMPANGLLYNTPSVCTCYINSKIKGFNALADHSPSRRLPGAIPEKGRLVRGKVSGSRDQDAGRAGEWPTYRGAPDRHGVASTPLSEAYASGWKTSIGGKLTQPVVAGDRVFVSAYDQHAVYALDVNNGKVKWRFQAGGVVNSPPTIWEGRAIFGCNDGWVYCVGTASGKMIWKYRAAPLDRRIIACENLESVWPVHGSVLVVADTETGKGKVYTVAGRSIFLDGGLRFLVLDAETGAKISETVMNDTDPGTGKNVQQGHEWPPDLPAGLPDVLSLSDNTIYMGIQPFSLDGKRREVYYPSRGLYRVDGRDAKPMTKRPSDEGIHLFSTIGFLDDSEMHRSVWMYGKDSFGGCWGFPVATYAHPSGQILSVMKDNVYGYGRQFYNEGNQQFMHLFATSRNPQLVTYEERFKDQKKKDRRGGPYISSKMATVPRPAWSRTTDTYVRALLAGTNANAGKPDLLCAVGFPEVIDEHDAIDLIKKQQRSGFKLDSIYRKEKSTKGELGAKLMVVSAESGKTISETKLDAPAVFDGMSAAYGKLFLSDIQGNVVCLKPSEKKGDVDLNVPVSGESTPAARDGKAAPPDMTANALSKETFAPYKAGKVPNSATDLWKDYDPRKEDLDVSVVKEWKDAGVVTRYITFKVGTFKGADSRIGAYYCFPDNGKKNPAFVWSHGGGQRADRNRGLYFARQGFASIDINWLGREMEKGITENTDWGNVDPTQGPRFYSKAKRKHWKRNLMPDEYTIDPVPSPRNNNWFLLVVAARRAITFLEQQPEVNADRIGLTGFSMGGTITAMAAIDPRVKAAVPFVGGTGFLHVDFPGLPGTSLKAQVTANLELYAKTVDPGAYWPLVKCPVMFISSSNDFHAALDRVYRSMALLKHKSWRVSTNIHENHGPGPEQWVLLNRWFNLHLKRVPQRIPVTPPSTLTVTGREATFTVTPEDRNNELLETEIYYSYDPNSRARFWMRADADQDAAGRSWIARMAVHENLPLYVFAICRYPLGETVELQQGSTSTLSVNSLEQSIVPEIIDLKELSKLEKTTLLDDFKNGFQDWGVRAGGGEICTYKFQSPHIDRSNDKKLSVSIDPKDGKLSLRLRAESRFLGHGMDLGSFSLSRRVEGNGPQNVMITRSDFKGEGGKELEWSKITRFYLSIVDAATKAKIDLTSEEGRAILRSIDLVDGTETVRSPSKTSR
jgi:outer membrane protein assembly factor BamB/dienelactone hydrolase